MICRTCLNSIECPDEANSINNYAKLDLENVSIKEMIEKCIPEMDLEVCDKPVVCNKCYSLLISAYIFRRTGLKSEEKVYQFIEENDLKLGDKIELKHLVKENSVLIVDDEESEEQICVEEKEIIYITSDTDTATDSAENNEILYRQKITGKSYLTRKYSCDKCEYKGYRQDLLEKHLLFSCKNKKDSKTYKCDQCSYGTTRKRHLTRHMFVHGGIKPFVCGICDKGFTEKNHIKDHMYKHSTYAMPYKCEHGQCKAAYSRKSDLNAHIKKHVNYRPFMCKLCNTGFFDGMQWDLHMRDAHGIDLC